MELNQDAWQENENVKKIASIMLRDDENVYLFWNTKRLHKMLLSINNPVETHGVSFNSKFF